MCSESRKTETVLRNFPHVFLFDSEGNSDQCIGMPEIAPFMRLKSKDTNEVVRVLDEIALGKIKFPDGSPIETVCFDSVSVYWGVQQEVAAVSAEKRAMKWNKSPDEATLTPIDWVIGKRPMKKLANRINTLPVKYLVNIAREKDPYIEDDGTKGKIKPPPVPDAVKGTDHDMNLALRFVSENGEWSYEVSKVQGALGKMFPMGAKGTKLDVAKLLEYSKNLTGAAAVEKDEIKLAKDIHDAEGVSGVGNKTMDRLLNLAEEMGVKKTDVGAILKEEGITGFNTANWDKMLDVIKLHAPA